MRIIFLLVALVCIISLAGCENSVDSRVENAQASDLYKTYGISDDRIAPSDPHKKPKKGFTPEAAPIVLVN